LTIRPCPARKRRQEALGHRHLTNEIDLELVTQLVKR
jgi:hypothetical protein